MNRLRAQAVFSDGQGINVWRSHSGYTYTGTNEKSYRLGICMRSRLSWLALDKRHAKNK